MKTFEYSPFSDVYAPYLVSPNVARPNRMRLIWEALSNSPLPTMTRWVIYNAMRTWQ